MSGLVDPEIESRWSMFITRLIVVSFPVTIATRRGPNDALILAVSREHGSQ